MPAILEGERLLFDEVVGRRCETWATRCRARGISLEASIESAQIAGRADQLAIMLDALLSNAMRFSDHGDHVRVVLRTTADRAELAVSDTGVGILPEEMAFVFDRFFRGSVGRERALGGSGIGLSIAQEIAHAHGGEIRGDSVLGTGSCFRLTLPLAEPHETSNTYTS